MDSEQSAYAAAQLRHHRYMYFGKKHRYIEVFQCSGDDMSLVLTGGIPTTVPVAGANAPVSPMKTLISPGMLNNTTTLLSTNPNHATTASTLLGAASIPSSTLIPQPAATAAAAAGVANLNWDPVSAQVAASLQMQQALSQVQALRSQQESVWLYQLAAHQQLQQQMQLAALSQAGKQISWADRSELNPPLFSCVRDDTNENNAKDVSIIL